MLVSYETVVTHRIHWQILDTVVPGALRFYDLPDLVAAIAPREVWIVNAVNGLGHQVQPGEVTRQYAHALEAFKSSGAEGAIHIRDRRPEEEIIKVYRELIERR